MYSTHVFHICILDNHSTHGLYPNKLYKYFTRAFCRCILYRYSTQEISLNIQQKYSTQVFYTCISDLYYTDVLYTSIIYMYSTYVFYIPRLFQTINPSYPTQTQTANCQHTPHNNTQIPQQYPPHNYNTPLHNLLPAAYSPGSDTPECDAGHRARYRHATGTQLPPKQPQNTRPHAT